MAALTPEDVANQSLGILTEGQIRSLDQDTKAARLCNLHFETTREAELTKHAWVFATFWVDSTSEDTGIEGATRYRYNIPEDALRVLPLRTEGWPHGLDIPYQQTATGIYTALSGPYRFAYIGNIIDPSVMPPLFIDVWTAALAVKIAHPLTQKSTMLKLAMDHYKMAVSEARKQNAIIRGMSAGPETFAQARGDWTATPQRLPGR